MAHRRAILFMIFVMMFSFLLTIVFGILFAQGILEVEIIMSPWFIIIFQVLSFLLPLAIWLGIHREKLNVHLPHMRLGSVNIICIVGLSLLLQPAMMVVSGLTAIFFPNQVSEMVMGMADYPYLLLIIAVAVTPAICEEVVFRGYMQKKYENKSFWTMAISTGFFFGVIHFNPQQFFYAFVMGIIFAYMVHATRSIRAAVISHFIMNASQVSLLWFTVRMTQFMEEQPDFFPEAYSAQPSDAEMIAAFALLGFIAIFSTIAAVILFNFFAKHNKQRIAEYEAKHIEETPENPPEELELQESKLRGRLIDGALILVIVSLYVIFIFVI
ncbi:MAG: CPBP family intramembrane metalloprotease [Defluviitaleaceae bacterium]|nr:CPBP family intramembrane metalloprotease [Defluviitaleaceae bacterium]